VRLERAGCQGLSALRRHPFGTSSRLTPLAGARRRFGAAARWDWRRRAQLRVKPCATVRSTADRAGRQRGRGLGDRQVPLVRCGARAQRRRARGAGRWHGRRGRSVPRLRRSAPPGPCRPPAALDRAGARPATDL